MAQGRAPPCAPGRTSCPAGTCAPSPRGNRMLAMRALSTAEHRTPSQGQIMKSGWLSERCLQVAFYCLFSFQFPSRDRLRAPRAAFRSQLEQAGESGPLRAGPAAAGLLTGRPGLLGNGFCTVRRQAATGKENSELEPGLAGPFPVNTGASPRTQRVVLARCAPWRQVRGSTAHPPSLAPAPPTPRVGRQAALGLTREGVRACLPGMGAGETHRHAGRTAAGPEHHAHCMFVVREETVLIESNICLQ